jgi:hypothetical protein
MTFSSFRVYNIVIPACITISSSLAHHNLVIPE